MNSFQASRFNILSFSRQFHCHRHQIIAASLQNNTRQRSRRRTLKNFTRPDREITFVARALQAVVGPRIIDRASQMRAFLAVRDVRLCVEVHQNAAVFRPGIAKQLDASHWNFTDAPDDSLWVCRLSVNPGTNQNPEIADEHAKARKHEKFGELAARDESFVRRVNGKFFLPKRFFAWTASPFHNEAFPSQM
jgi:hypothetical protein